MLNYGKRFKKVSEILVFFKEKSFIKTNNRAQLMKRVDGLLKTPI